MRKIIICNLLLVLISLQLLGQTDLVFKYESSDKITKKIHADIILYHPNRQINKLYSDTLKTIEFKNNDYLKDIGEYILIIIFDGFGQNSDSVTYSFELDGNETEIEIKVSNSVDLETVYKQGKWAEVGRKNNGYISIIRYLKSLENVGVNLGVNRRVGMTAVFDLINNSSDTLYGEHLPGYFWGQISHQTNDLTWSRKTVGRIDMNCFPADPLYPNSSKIATIGTFGEYRYSSKGIYKFEVLYSKTGDNHGYYRYITTENLNWWVKTEEFYRLQYIYEIY